MGWQITVETEDLGVLAEHLQRASRGGYPRYQEGMRTALDHVRTTWISMASSGEVGFRCRSSAHGYLGALAAEQAIEYPRAGSMFVGAVRPDVPYADVVDFGAPPRDMKPDLLAGRKTRISKKGEPYIIIPFRHGIPGTTTMPAMPVTVYRQAQRLAFSPTVGTYGALNIHGQMIRRKVTAWGAGHGGEMGPARLGASAYGQRTKLTPRLLGLPPYTWKTGLYAGMVRVGRPGHAGYLTFRAVSEKSDPSSWIHPGIRPSHISQRVAEKARPEVVRILSEALLADIEEGAG